jgi:hypothetical protein
MFLLIQVVLQSINVKVVKVVKMINSHQLLNLVEQNLKSASKVTQRKVCTCELKLAKDVFAGSTQKPSIDANISKIDAIIENLKSKQAAMYEKYSLSKLI